MALQKLIYGKLDCQDLMNCIKQINLINKEFYAPSWQSYLVGENVNGDWKALDKKFLSSRYYMETKAFLESDVLYKMLEKQECGFHD